MNRSFQVWRRWISAPLCVVAGLMGSLEPVQAQFPPPQPQPLAAIAPCQPPQPSEYLLLVVTRTPETQAQVKQLLPPTAATSTCGYLADTVTRVGGFRTIERANAWARYITETTGLAAFVARPAEAPATATTPAPSPPPSDTPASKPMQPPTIASGYSPKPLGAGYAVLVDYHNQPEMAAKVRQVLGQDVGLVAYGRSPFLLALYTADANTAYTTLRTLSDRGFLATLVDSRRVVLLRQPIALPQ